MWGGFLNEIDNKIVDTNGINTDESIEETLYGVKDIQRIFGIGRNKALALLKSDGFPTLKLGNTFRVEATQLKTWIENNRGKNIKLKKE